MRMSKSFLGSLLAALMAAPLAAQTATPSPVLSSIESPYPAVQSAVHIAGGSYAPGAVSYGPAGTPLVISGKDFGGSGAVSGPFESLASEGDGDAGVALPPIRDCSGSSESGTFGANAASACIAGEGRGHPHSSGTSASTLLICPE